MVEIVKQTAIIHIGNAKGGSDVHYIAKIDIKKYKCITEDITTDEVIITEEIMGFEVVDFVPTIRRWYDRGNPRDAGEWDACQSPLLWGHGNMAPFLFPIPFPIPQKIKFR